MRTSALGSSLLVMVLVSACNAADPGPSPTPSPVIGAGGAGGQTGGGGGNQGGPGGGSGSSGGAGGGQQGGGGGAGGGGGNTVTRTWSETVTNPLGTVHQEYRASVHVAFGQEEAGSWVLTGTADITSAFTNEVTEQLQDITGAPCTTHHTDAASASGSVDVEGGIEARDGFYQFHLFIPSVDGTNTSLRDDSACGGPNTTESNVWTAAEITASGDGEYSGTSISGSVSNPREGGEDTTSWSFTLPQ